MLDRFEDHCELLVVFPFERFDLTREVAVCVHEPAQLHECAHDGDVSLSNGVPARCIHLYCAGAAQHAREHGDALLGKGIRAVAASAAAFL